MQALNDYIRRAREMGAQDIDIRVKLEEAGWDTYLVKHALELHKDPPTPPQPQTHHASSKPTNDAQSNPVQSSTTTHTQPTTTTNPIGMWDGFEHALMFLSLYVYATALGMLMHQFINHHLPQSPTSSNWYVDAQRTIWPSIIRWSIAALIVSFPLFAFLYYDIQKRTQRNPQIRALKSRKFFTYITLVGAFIIAVTKIVQTVFAFLDGNVGANFAAHIALTITIVGLIFFRFLADVKNDRKL